MAAGGLVPSQTYKDLIACADNTAAKATYVFSSHDCIFHWDCELIDIFYSLLTASMFCHRGRHRCDTVTHACLQPTRGLSLKADLDFCVRLSRARPQYMAKDCCCG